MAKPTRGRWAEVRRSRLTVPVKERRGVLKAVGGAIVAASNLGGAIQLVQLFWPARPTPAPTVLTPVPVSIAVTPAPAVASASVPWEAVSVAIGRAVVKGESVTITPGTGELRLGAE